MKRYSARIFTHLLLRSLRFSVVPHTLQVWRDLFRQGMSPLLLGSSGHILPKVSLLHAWVSSPLARLGWFPSWWFSWTESYTRTLFRRDYPPTNRKTLTSRRSMPVPHCLVGSCYIHSATLAETLIQFLPLDARMF